MECEINKPEQDHSAMNRFARTEFTRMGNSIFLRLTVQSGERYFYLFCTRDSLEHLQDEIILWVDKLARQLYWRNYKIWISTASTAEATERKYALFDYRPKSLP